MILSYCDSPATLCGVTFDSNRSSWQSTMRRDPLGGLKPSSSTPQNVLASIAPAFSRRPCFLKSRTLWNTIGSSLSTVAGSSLSAITWASLSATTPEGRQPVGFMWTLRDLRPKRSKVGLMPFVPVAQPGPEMPDLSWGIPSQEHDHVEQSDYGCRQLPYSDRVDHQ